MIKKLVQSLREGWFENGEDYALIYPFRKLPVNCRAIWTTCLNITGTKFGSIYEGTIG